MKNQNMAMKMEYSTLIVLAAAIAPSVAGAQSAAGWPSKPVTIIVPFSAGATVDIETRMWANKLAENTGGSFVLDFKPGAGTTIGLGHVARATPDGHTLGSMTPTITIAKLTLPKANFDVLRDLMPISLMSKRPVVLVVPPAFPAKTMKEYVAYARANPGKVNVGTAGAGGLAELGWNWFNNLAGIKTTLVHYKGGAPSFRAVMAGEVDIILGGFSTAAGPIRAGKLKALAVSTPERNALMPDIPTVREQGIPWVYEQWIGIAAPAATPQAIAARISSELAKVAKAPEIAKKLANQGSTLVGTTPAQFRGIIEDEVSRWTRVAKESGMKFGK